MRRTAAALAMSASLAAGGAMAADFPGRPVTAVVQMAPGGPTDLLVRVVQQRMGDALGQSVIVENKAGASGLIGLRHVLNAPADGYTVGIASATSHGVAVNIYEKLAYDPLKDFKPVGGIVIAPGVLIASKQITPDCKFETLLEKLKAEPGKYKFGSAGIGTLAHISGEAFLAEVGASMLHVPYRGLGPAMVDLYGGSVDVIFDNISSAKTHIESGKVCALAVQSPERVAGYESIPTYKELGYPQLNRPTWYGMIVREDTPDTVVAELNKALNQALASEDVVRTYAGMGVAPIPDTPQAFGQRMQDEILYWQGVVEKIGFEKLKM
ncbi:twin-arginine translocation pathway signal [Bordetella trematum]|uniref:Putattive exported protein n=2 Tax=Bordetella trematum TaxID=123899 RepID=A0A157SND1_9BORD|nr:tripartite tricarboxylate transporter substrate binding protein [Bordetella trematum]AZR93767.1 twin-arginine translocation pathway signal [Bordetella trematum]NNH21022.1 tripartite tricarboxylate transporter substrate binding protein [Bordetella trematum]QIM72345.1 tripartite tricarboxylate transporter substrate binding protein [Bordetella trematum]SAH99142.1 putattive exported protein [Bordetella trematum]SAI38872.1 putattive exported protein [Bordetella trematum]